jgi:hypothetical protein
VHRTGNCRIARRAWYQVPLCCWCRGLRLAWCLCYPVGVCQDVCPCLRGLPFLLAVKSWQCFGS